MTEQEKDILAVHENYRHNRAVEQENTRHNKEQEELTRQANTELARHNVAGERISQYQNYLNTRYFGEQTRHNKVTESISDFGSTTSRLGVLAESKYKTDSIRLGYRNSDISSFAASKAATNQGKQAEAALSQAETAKTNARTRRDELALKNVETGVDAATKLIGTVLDGVVKVAKLK